MYKIFHTLMYKCIHKPLHPTQTLRTFTYEPVWQSSNHHIQVCQIGQAFKKPVMCSTLHGLKAPSVLNIGLQFLASGLSISHEICMKSTGFHEIWQISCEIHPKPYKSKCFNQNYSVWWMQERGYDPGFHEIRGHSPLPAPPKLKSFCWNIWFYKVLGGFHLKSAGFHECELLRDDQV